MGCLPSGSATRPSSRSSRTTGRSSETTAAATTARALDLDSERSFIGKAALLKIRETGVTRRIVGIELAGEPLEQGIFTERWPAIAGGPIGEVLVALHSPRLDKNIGYAMVAIDHASPGAAMTVASPVGDLAARVVEMPFVATIKTDGQNT